MRMIGDGPPLVLDPKQVEAARERIKTRYNVVAEQNLDEQPPAQHRSRQEKLMRTATSHSFALGICSALRRSASAAQKGNRRPAESRSAKPKEAFARPGECDRPAVRLLAAVAKEGAVLETRSRRGSAAGPRACHGRSGGESKLRRAGARRVRRKDARPMSWWSITKRTSRCSSRPIRNSSMDYAARSRARHRRGRSACRLAIGSDRRARRHRRSRHHDPDDALSGGRGRVSHLPAQHSDAVSR